MKVNAKNLRILKVLCAIYLAVIVVLAVFLGLEVSQRNQKNQSDIKIPDELVAETHRKLVRILGKPTYVEVDGEKKLKSATWQSPLDNFHGFGKYGGSDLIKIHGTPSKKWHPHPAKLFVILGKYISVPEHLLGPLKYASETINIEQLFIPKKYSEQYFETGKKEVALVTGSCASVTISAITVQFAMDMIQKYQDDVRSLELYETFRNEYDRRIHNYLCGKGITDEIPWFDPKYFEEPIEYHIGDEKCASYNPPENVVEGFSHFPDCAEIMGDDKDGFCKREPDHKCC